MAEPYVATETQSKIVATKTDASKTLGTKDILEEDPEEYDEDGALSNEETEEEGHNDSQ